MANLCTDRIMSTPTKAIVNLSGILVWEDNTQPLDVDSISAGHSSDDEKREIHVDLV